MCDQTVNKSQKIPNLRWWLPRRGREIKQDKGEAHREPQRFFF